MPYPSGVDDTKALKVGYLGPAGTFTESALLTQVDLAAAEHILFRAIEIHRFCFSGDE